MPNAVSICVYCVTILAQLSYTTDAARRWRSKQTVLVHSWRFRLIVFEMCFVALLWASSIALIVLHGKKIQEEKIIYGLLGQALLPSFILQVCAPWP